MSSFSDYTFLSCSGKNQIHVRSCSPEGPIKAIVQIAHGVAEHAGRYDGFMENLAKHGILAVANDHLGHGKSADDESQLGFFAENSGWETVVGDMHRLITMTKEQHPNVPYFLYGHSMGSFLVRTFIIRFPEAADGAVIAGTAQMSPLLQAAGAALSAAVIKKHGKHCKSKLLDQMAFGGYNKVFEPARTPKDWISRDPAEVDRYVADPLCGFLVSAGLFSDMAGGIKFITDGKNVSRMSKSLPVLFIAGDSDPVGDMGKGVMKAYESFMKAGVSDVTLKLYPGARHDLLAELCRVEVTADVISWLESKI